MNPGQILNLIRSRFSKNVAKYIIQGSLIPASEFELLDQNAILHLRPRRQPLPQDPRQLLHRPIRVPVRLPGTSFEEHARYLDFRYKEVLVVVDSCGAFT